MHVRLIRSLEQIGSDNDFPELPPIKYKYLQPNHTFPEKKIPRDNPAFEVNYQYNNQRSNSIMFIILSLGFI